MPILNYRTQVAAEKTVGEISSMLAKHGVSAILTEYDEAGDVAAMSFRVRLEERDLAFRLPANWQAVLTLLEQDQKVRKQAKTKAQAIRVAWRILKDWVEAQLALIETRMVRVDEVFLPYLIVDDGQTLYQHLQAHHMALPAGAAGLTDTARG
jgi:hypothetical protein